MSIGGFDLESTHSRSGREHVTAFHLISPFPFPFPFPLFPFHMIKCRNAQEKTYNAIHFCPLNEKKKALPTSFALFLSAHRLIINNHPRPPHNHQTSLSLLPPNPLHLSYPVSKILSSILIAAAVVFPLVGAVGVAKWVKRIENAHAPVQGDKT